MILDLIIVSSVLIYCSKVYKWNEYPSATAIVLVLYSLYVYGGAIYTYNLYISREWVLSDQFGKTVNLIRVGFISLVVACILANKIIPRARIQDKSIILNSYKSEKTAVTLFAVVSFAIGILYLYVVPSVPLKYLFLDSELLATAREEATTTYRYFIYFSNFIYGYIPIVTMYYYFVGDKFKFFALFVLLFTLSIATGQKAPVVYLVILMTLSVSLKHKKMYIYKYAFLLLCIFIFLVGFVFYENRYSNDQMSSEVFILIIDGLMLRIFGGASTLIAYVEYFPLYENFSFFHVSNLPMDQTIYRYMYPDSLIIGSANAVFLGNLYAITGNFLAIGIIALFGFLLVFYIDNYWFNKMESNLHFALYVFFSITCLKFVLTDYNTAFTNFSYPIFSLYGYVLLFSSLKNKGVIDARPFNNVIACLSILIFIYVLQGQIKGLFISK